MLSTGFNHTDIMKYIFFYPIQFFITDQLSVINDESTMFYLLLESFNKYIRCELAE